MKREIKFRSFYNDKSMLFSDSYVNLCHFFELKPEDYPLMQFTGLKDKNGIDIYEGDVLKINLFGDEWNTYVRDYLGTLVVDVEGCDWNTTATSFLDDESELEVIGNIYENPELLKP